MAESNSAITELDLSDEELPEQSGYQTEVASLEQPLTVLVDQLKLHFENGEYSLLIGDDTSGRLPTLAVHKVVDYVCDLRGLLKVATFFIQAGRYVDEETIRHQVESLKSRYVTHENNKALLITEYIKSGESIKRLTEILRDNGISFDIAAVAMSEPEAAYREKGVFDTETKVFLGSPIIPTVEHDKLEIWSKPTLTGLKPARKKGSKVSVLKLGSEIRKDTIKAR